MYFFFFFLKIYAPYYNDCYGNEFFAQKGTERVVFRRLFISISIITHFHRRSTFNIYSYFKWTRPSNKKPSTTRPAAMLINYETFDADGKNVFNTILITCTETVFAGIYSKFWDSVQFHFDAVVVGDVSFWRVRVYARAYVEREISRICQQNGRPKENEKN